MDAFQNWLFNQGPEMLVSIVSALIIVIVGFILSRVAVRLLRKVLDRGKLREEQMLISLICRVVRTLVLVLAGIMALQKIGVSVAPFIAGLGVSGLVFGFAFKDTLSNFASGLLLMIYRPFQMGDVVDIGGTMGIVQELTVVNTRMKAFDGPVIYLPNSSVWGSKIINISSATTRRKIFDVGIDYGDDAVKAFKVIEQALSEDERILQDPSPFVRLSGLGDSSVDFQVFVYTKPDDFGSVSNAFYASLKAKLEGEGFSIPFPQRDIHLTGDSSNIA